MLLVMALVYALAAPHPKLGYAGELAMARGLAMVKDPAFARAELARLERRWPQEARPLYLDGMMAIAQERFGEAERALEAAEAIDPKDLDIGLSLSAVYVRNGKPEQAESLLEHLAQAHPRTGSVHYNLGLLAVERGRFAKARAAFQTFLKLSGPADADKRIQALNYLKLLKVRS